MHGEQVSSSTFGGVRSDHAIEPNDLGAGQDLSYFGAASIPSSCLLQPEGSTADLARVVPTLVAVRCAVAWPHSAVSHGEGVQWGSVVLPVLELQDHVDAGHVEQGGVFDIV